MFLKEKFNADGSFQKLKARLVAGGNTQDRTVYESISSPTASLTAVLTVATIAAKEQRIVQVVDITGAYLNASMGKVKVFMRIDGQLAELMGNLDPKFKGCTNNDGSIIVQLKKALYGCIESAKLWYELLVKVLKEDFGMVENPYDKCVLNKSTSSGVQLTVVIYVDDLFITCTEQSVIKELLSFLKVKFTTIIEHSGPILSYLGMSFNYSVSGKVKVTMQGYINDLLDTLKVQGTVSTPATNNLFSVVDDEKANPPLSVKSGKEFHTVVAKLLYLAKRARPDILTAVTFLASRVQKSTVEDQLKLTRLLKYLNGTRDCGITLEQRYNYPVAYCDASYGIHPDCKSHTGLYITLGSGPIFVGSSKQKVIAKSTTEAELIALSDSAGQILWTREFICGQLGSDSDRHPPAIIYEDNLSTIALLKTGKSQTQRTKHIKIRYYFLKDRQDKGEVLVKHISTDNMIADIFTKPLQGSQFNYLRSKLLNS